MSAHKRGEPSYWTTPPPSPTWLGSDTHRTAGTEPFAVGDLRKRGVQAVDVVGRRTGITAQQLPTILADATELHVVVILLFRVSPNLFQDLLTLRIVLFSLPLDAFFLLQSRDTESGYDHPPPRKSEPHPSFL